MSDQRIGPPIPGSRLPELHLTTVGGAKSSVQPTPRDAVVLLWLAEWSGVWLDALITLARAADDIEEWSAHIVIMIPAAAETAAGLRARIGGRLDLRLDPDGEAARALGFGGERACLLISDRFRQVYMSTLAQRASDLPEPSEIEEWTRYLATQCPECGVIDEPGHGEWESG